jgi:glycosyltransferase involved in cell wall biosynthesis
MAAALPAPPPDSRAPLIVEGLFSFQLGGSERVGADVALECARRGYRVLCFAFYDSEGPMRRELEAGGVQCVDLNYLKRLRYLRRFTYQVALFRFLRRLDAHAVHIHHATSFILGALPARFAGVARVIMTEHSIIEFQTMPKYRRQSRRYCRFADAISVIHPSMQPYFREVLGVPADRLFYIPNGVRLLKSDPVARAGLRRELDIGAGDFLWMFAGRLAAVKDLGTLIKAFALAREQASARLRLVVIGDGPERPMLESLCQSLQLEAAISFLGARTQVPRLMQAADGFAMSSLSEGLPMVLLEAMAARVPCVATAVGGIPELFAGGAGILTAPQDIPGLGAALLRLTADPELRGRMIDVAFAKVAGSNDLNRVVDEYLRLFELPPHWRAGDGAAPGVIDAG